jgi:hypothetical protein
MRLASVEGKIVGALEEGVVGVCNFDAPKCLLEEAVNVRKTCKLIEEK